MTAAASSSQPADSAPLDPIAATALEEVQFLGRQHRDALRSPDFTKPDLARFDERMAAYIDVLVVRGSPVIEWLLTKLHTAETAADACGIGVVLLESRDPRAADGLLATVAAAEQEPLVHGLQAALRRGPLERVLPRLREWLASGTPREAASAAEALAFHRQLDKNSPRLAQLMDDVDPIVRRAAWRAAALAG
jgi:hypothetical protein